MVDDNKVYDWDDKVALDPDEGPSFRVLEPGYYPFEVTAFQRERFKGSSKTPPCPMARLTLKVTDQHGTATVFERLYLIQRAMWKVAAFFESIGAPRDGDGKIVPDWNIVEGAQGWMKLKKRSYESNGETKTANEVDRFCRADEVAAAEAAFAEQCGAAPQAAPAAACAPQAQQAAPMPPQQYGAAYAGPPAVQQAMPGMPAAAMPAGGSRTGWSMS